MQIFLPRLILMKRSKLLWSNHKDKINIYITENINNPINSPKWKQEYKNIKVIIYEYMAIIYNKIEVGFEILNYWRIGIYRFKFYF